jgi:hypothetical protein
MRPLPSLLAGASVGSAGFAAQVDHDCFEDTQAGKSAVVTALVFPLGGTARTSNRGSRNKGFIKSLLHQPLINQNGITTYEVFETAAFVRINPLSSVGGARCAAQGKHDGCEDGRLPARPSSKQLCLPWAAWPLPPTEAPASKDGEGRRYLS